MKKQITLTAIFLSIALTTTSLAESKPKETDTRQAPPIIDSDFNFSAFDMKLNQGKLETKYKQGDLPKNKKIDFRNSQLLFGANGFTRSTGAAGAGISIKKRQNYTSLSVSSGKFGGVFIGPFLNAGGHLNLDYDTQKGRFDNIDLRLGDLSGWSFGGMIGKGNASGSGIIKLFNFALVHKVDGAVDYNERGLEYNSSEFSGHGAIVLNDNLVDGYISLKPLANFLIGHAEVGETKGGILSWRPLTAKVGAGIHLGENIGHARAEFIFDSTIVRSGSNAISYDSTLGVDNVFGKKGLAIQYTNRQSRSYDDEGNHDRSVASHYIGVQYDFGANASQSIRD